MSDALGKAIVSLFKEIASDVAKIPKEIDIAANETLGKSNDVWSDYGGRDGQTISESLGWEKIKAAYQLFLKGVDMSKLDSGDIDIPKEHIIGEFSSALCDIFQDWHAMRCANRHWDTPQGQALKEEYPGIQEFTEELLEEKGFVS